MAIIGSKIIIVKLKQTSGSQDTVPERKWLLLDPEIIKYNNFNV